MVIFNTAKISIFSFPSFIAYIHACNRKSGSPQSGYGVYDFPGRSPKRADMQVVCRTEELTGKIRILIFAGIHPVRFYFFQGISVENVEVETVCGKRNYRNLPMKRAYIYMSVIFLPAQANGTK
jgi:hypothetical protein